MNCCGLNAPTKMAFISCDTCLPVGCGAKWRRCRCLPISTRPSSLMSLKRIASLINSPTCYAICVIGVLALFATQSLNATPSIGLLADDSGSSLNREEPLVRNRQLFTNDRKTEMKSPAASSSSSSVNARNYAASDANRPLGKVEKLNAPWATLLEGKHSSMQSFVSISFLHRCRPSSFSVKF